MADRLDHRPRDAGGALPLPDDTRGLSAVEATLEHRANIKRFELDYYDASTRSGLSSGKEGQKAKPHV